MNPLTQFKKIPILPLLIALALVALASPTVARADAVTDWNLIASNCNRRDCGAAAASVGAAASRWCRGRSMTRSTRSTVAISRTSCSLLQIRRTRRKPPRRRQRSVCSWAVFPGHSSATLQPLYDAYIAGLPDNPPGSRAAGIAIGETTASGNAHRPDERRTLRAAADAVPASTGRLATNAAELRERPRAMGRERAAVHRPERRDAPHRRAERAHQCRLRGGLQRDQGGRLTHEHDPNGGPDRCCDLLAGPCASRSGTGSFARLPPARTWTSSTALACSRWRTWLRLTH